MTVVCRPRLLLLAHFIGPAVNRTKLPILCRSIARRTNPIRSANQCQVVQALMIGRENVGLFQNLCCADSFVSVPARHEPNRTPRADQVFGVLNGCSCR
jgi:hypothetical protein